MRYFIVVALQKADFQNGIHHFKQSATGTICKNMNLQLYIPKNSFSDATFCWRIFLFFVFNDILFIVVDGYAAIL